MLFNITQNVLRFLYLLIKAFMSKLEDFFYFCGIVYAV